MFERWSVLPQIVETEYQGRAVGSGHPRLVKYLRGGKIVPHSSHWYTSYVHQARRKTQSYFVTGFEAYSIYSIPTRETKSSAKSRTKTSCGTAATKMLTAILKRSSHLLETLCLSIRNQWERRALLEFEAISIRAGETFTMTKWYW